MNNYKAIIDNILTWAKRHTNIRTVILIGSQARTIEHADVWSDLDMLLIADNISEYIQTTSWIAEFGTPLLTFIETAFDASYERRVLYEGFLDVDFALSEPEGFKASLASGEVRTIFQRGYRILLDKDDWSSALEQACALPQRPEIAPQKVLNEINDYWYHCVWVTKKLQRGELWVAMNCLNCYMKTKLLSMIELMTTRSADQVIDTWHSGRFLEKWADPSIVQRLPGSFTDYDAHALRVALHHQMELYHDMASHVAASQGLSYPTEEIQKIMDWIMKKGK